MENNFTSYRINHKGKNYKLSTEIFLNYIRIRCVEANKPNPLEYSCDFSLDYLRKACSAFYSTLTVRDAQNLINQIIESEKIDIQNTGTQIIVNLFLINQNQNFSFLLNKSPNNNVQITYSPPKYLPTKKVILPTQYIKRPTIYSNTINNYSNNNNNNYANNIPYFTQNNDSNLYQTNYYPINLNELLGTSTTTTTTIPNYTTNYNTFTNYEADSQKI